MKRGCLIFAFNGAFDYVTLANHSARNIKRHLDLPTSVITNKDITFQHNFDQVIITNKPTSSNRYFIDIKKTEKWINGDRCNAYELSPYDDTILLDADYVVSSDILTKLFSCNSEILYHKHSIDVVGNEVFERTLNKFGVFSMPMYWATVMFFKRSEYVSTFFDVMKMVQRNYVHYSQLYNFSPAPFRNDYALSITDLLMSGHFINDNNKISWNLVDSMPGDEIMQLGDDKYEIKFNENKECILVNHQDLHVMGKMNLKDIYEYHR